MSLEHLQPYLTQPGLCPNPIFVFGAPRSGTHALAFSLAAHGRLYTHSESEILAKLFHDDPIQEIIEDADQRVLPTWLRMYGVSKAELYGFLGVGFNALFTSRAPAGKRWIDKTPQYVLMGPILADMFPGAQFLHMIRDGRRVVHSMSQYLERFTSEARTEVIKSGHLKAWATDFRAACRTWRSCLDAGMRFAAEQPKRVLTVAHAELVKAPDRAFQEVFAFLDVAAEPAPLNFFRSYRLNTSFPTAPTELPGTANLSKPLDQWTLQDGGHFVEPSPYRESEPWRSWPRARRAIFMEEAGAAMIEHGFATAADLELWSNADAEIPAPASAGTEPATAAGLEVPLLERIRRIAARALPPRAAVLVAGKQPADPMTLDGCHTFRYPRAYLPADSTQAIAHLETLRDMGAGFLLFPGTEFWWFEQYPEFRLHLETKYQQLWNDENCVIFLLRRG